MNFSEKDSKDIHQNKFDFNRTWSVSFQFWRDYEKEPLTKQELDQIQDEFLEIFKKHNMSFRAI